MVLDGAPEWPTPSVRCCPTLAGKGASSISGCGFGWFCRFAREAGRGREVLGRRPSPPNMAGAGGRREDGPRMPAVTYRQADLETPRPAGGARSETVYSSLTLHYLEKPRCVVQDGPSPRWCRGAASSFRPSTHSIPSPAPTYLDEGPAHEPTGWPRGVVKQHRAPGSRPISNLLIGRGLHPSQSRGMGTEPRPRSPPHPEMEDRSSGGRRSCWCRPGPRPGVGPPGAPLHATVD